jgi:hypothetical protein
LNFNVIDLLISVSLASFGGLVKKIADSEKNAAVKRTAAYFFGGSLISIFIGVTAYLICTNFNVSGLLTAGISGIAGYMGTPVLNLLSNIVKKRLKKEAGAESDDKKTADDGTAGESGDKKQDV